MTDDLTITCMAGRSDAKKAYEQKIAQLKADRRGLAESILNMADTLQSTIGLRVFDTDILQKAQQWAKE